jgi:two-component sensor histidine kinase
MNSSSDGADPAAIQWLARLPLTRERPVLGLLLAAAFSLIALMLRFELDPMLPPGFPYLTFFPAVIATAFLFGLAPAILAGLLCGFFSRWFFMQPAGTLSLGGGAGVGMALYFFVIAVDITLVELMQRAFSRVARERELNRRLADHREVLFRELQHRVGNNLQMVGSLLALQKRTLTDPEGRNAIDEASRRLQLIGRIQRQLYDPGAQHASLGSFLTEVVSHAVGTAGDGAVTWRVEGDTGTSVHPDDAIPIGLIVAESVANAIEHGFAGHASGQILVALARSGDRIAIRIENDGNPVAEGFDPAQSTSLGLKLVRSLAGSRGGTYTVKPGGLGTVAELDLPAGAEVG